MKLQYRPGFPRQETLSVPPENISREDCLQEVPERNTLKAIFPRHFRGFALPASIFSIMHNNTCMKEEIDYVPRMYSYFPIFSGAVSCGSCLTFMPICFSGRPCNTPNTFIGNPDIYLEFQQIREVKVDLLVGTYC